MYQRPENNKLERCYGGYVGAQYNVDPLYSQNESLDSLLSLDCTEDINHHAQPASGHQRPENNRLERSYGGYIGADYHPNNLTLAKNDTGTPKVTKRWFSDTWLFFLSISHCSRLYSFLVCLFMILSIPGTG